MIKLTNASFPTISTWVNPDNIETLVWSEEASNTRIGLISGQCVFVKETPEVIQDKLDENVYHESVTIQKAGIDFR